MKFGKLIQALLDATLPTWKDKFLAYKLLKKRLNSLLAESIRAVEEHHGSVYEAGVDLDRYSHSSYQHDMKPGDKRRRIMCDEATTSKRQHLLDDPEFRRLLEEEFKMLLEGELEKMNEFVVEKEGEFLILSQRFNEEVQKLKAAIEANERNQLDLINLLHHVVAFHGEMVLLKNYSSLNYTGLVKIVKKHDRLTGALLGLSFIPNVRQQPFYNIDTISRLVQDCESNLLPLFPSYTGDSSKQQSFEKDKQVSAFKDDSIFSEDLIKQIHINTMAALQTIKNMGKGSSTYNPLSMLQCEDDDAGSAVEE